MPRGTSSISTGANSGGSSLGFEATLTPYAREEFLTARVPRERLSRLERARRFLVATMMEELLELCCSTKCMILLSGYDTALYRKLLPSKEGWKRKLVKTHTRDTTGKDYVRTEVLWLNKHFVNAAKTGRVPIQLTKKEQRQNKINPVR
jgi:hypothetical protein